MPKTGIVPFRKSKVEATKADQMLSVRHTLRKRMPADADWGMSLPSRVDGECQQTNGWGAQIRGSPWACVSQELCPASLCRSFERVTAQRTTRENGSRLRTGSHAGVTLHFPLKSCTETIEFHKAAPKIGSGSETGRPRRLWSVQASSSRDFCLPSALKSAENPYPAHSWFPLRDFSKICSGISNIFIELIVIFVWG